MYRGGCGRRERGGRGQTAMLSPGNAGFQRISSVSLHPLDEQGMFCDGFVLMLALIFVAVSCQTCVK